MQVKLVSKLISFFFIVIFAQASPEDKLEQIYSQPWLQKKKKKTSIGLGLTTPGQSSDPLRVLWRESRSGGAAVQCHFTAEMRGLFVSFTVRELEIKAEVPDVNTFPKHEISR